MKKCIKLIFCVALSLCIVLSPCLVELGAKHNCVGDDCQICHDIALQRELLKSSFIACLYYGVMLTVSQVGIFISLFVGTAKIKLSLVANKVKLTA